MNYRETKITVKVDRILYPRNVSADEVRNVPTFYILKTNLGTVKGKLSAAPEENEAFVLEGKWEVSKFNGSMEFLFFHASAFLPTDERSMLRYACEMTKGLGIQLENRIWEVRREDWRNVALSDGIRGLSVTVLGRLQETIARIGAQQERTAAVAWLLSIGCTVRMAEAAYDRWGKRTVTRVKEDCYVLADLPNFSFRDVDEHVRSHFGIGRDDRRRIRAAIVYYVRQLTVSNTVCNWFDLFSAVSKAIDAAPEMISETCSALFAEKSLIPFRASGMIAAVRDFNGESDIRNFVLNAPTPESVKARQNKSGIRFDDSQLAAIQFALDGGFAVINGGAGAGKCLGAGTPVIMFDMTVKNVENLRVEDVLLGPNGEPKHITSITSGREEMFRITPKRGDSFTCNRSHILSVIHSRKRIRKYTDNAKKPFNISVDEIISTMKPAQREHLKCWRPTSISRTTKEVSVSPYFIGVWLGDGSGADGAITISNSDHEIISWMKAFAATEGLKFSLTAGYEGHSCPTMRFYSTAGRVRGSNKLKAKMRELGLFNGEKHIPMEYVDNGEAIRLQLLAGLIDSDGYYGHGVYEITQKSESLARGIAFVARSLGFGVSINPCRKCCCNTGAWGDYWRIFISGEIDRIPCIVERKKAKPRRQVKNPRTSNIKIESIGVGDYYGFTLAEEDGLFLLGDFTVTHNTTIIKSIADTLTNAGKAVELCAFAGKAAARLKEATGHEACTIHRMLDYRGDFGFTRKSLRGSTVILDEASMVSSDLMAEIVRRNPDRLILVGDEAQLPPVGSGQPFHDIVHLFPDRVRTLTTCYRNREAIFNAALKIRQGVAPELSAKSESELWDVQNIRDIRVTHGRILDLVRTGEVDFDEDIILCCRNGESDGDTECSVVAMNRDIKNIVNPNAAHEPKIEPGDRVINTKNHPELDVWNGTTGKCDRFDTDGGMWVELDYPNAAHESFVLIPRKQVKEWQLAYALTVHKAQGSQYRKVFFVCTRRDTAQLLDRPMLYTAVTRAKSECHIIGDITAFYAAINATERKLTVMQELNK